MEGRRYYSVRKGINQGELDFDLNLLKRAFNSIYSDFNNKYYFQKAFGYKCVDDGTVPGTTGSDIEIFFLRKLLKPNLWPIGKMIDNYSEDDLFDVIELLYDLIAKPLVGYEHKWNNCGWHYQTFDDETGQSEFRKEINEILRSYREGYELSASGEILLIGDKGLEDLHQEEVPEFDPDNIDERLKQAVLKFRRYKSSDEEKREAVRTLADILEYLRDKLGKHGTYLLSKDEDALFNIANNFGIRHHNLRQQTNYDATTWLPWMFYIYLASIHLSIRLIQRANSEADED
ncbi:hypothetical protein SZ63_05610 [Methanoculleus sediminis]|uniref:Uncharacterized protein n=1 Tax=Methanoculleus sediminis TaxID=1550566 RepID=A0A0H1R0Y2_9EURY|nr:hypothetical protein [Methanoculleus sediminis]KLK88491.1 hypothetical protein SZ63_05610 [Methanoculleus sediminis]